MSGPHMPESAGDYFLPVEAWPAGFVYPLAFVGLVEHSLVDLEPWRVLRGEALLKRHAGLRSRYPGRDSVPFAERQDNDDVAVLVEGGQVLIVHDYASPGWELHGSFADVHQWLIQAVHDYVDFAS